MALSVDPNRPEAERPAGPDARGPLTVHYVRFRPADDDPASYDPVGTYPDLPSSLLEHLGWIVAAQPEQGTANLSLSRLPDGRRVLCRVTATALFHPGKADWVDALFVLLPPGPDQPDAVSTSSFLAAVWPEVPDGGSAVPLRELVPGPGPVPRALIDFAVDRRGQVEAFLADLRGLFAEPSGPQLVVVERRPEEVYAWLALALASLPAERAAALTFTAFTETPHRAVQQIIGIPPSALSALGQEEIAHLYRVRGDCGAAGSPQASEAWARVAATLWQIGRPELITDQTRVLSRADLDLDGARLAVVALVHGVELGLPSRLQAARWIGETGNVSLLRDHDLDTMVGILAATATECHARPAGAAEPHAGSRGPDPDWAEVFAEAHAALASSRRPGELAPFATALARPMVEAALADCAGIGPDPLAALRLDEAARRVLNREYGNRVLEALDVDGQRTAAWFGGALALARALGTDVARAREPLAARLARILLDPRLAAERSAASALLERGAGADLGPLVVARLEERAAQSHAAGDSVTQALARSAELGGWLSRQDLSGAPLLRVAAKAAELVSVHLISGLTLFRDLWRSVDQPDDVRVLETMWTLSWPGTEPDLHSIVALCRLVPAASLARGAVGRRLTSIFGRYVDENADHQDTHLLTQMAQVLLKSAEFDLTPQWRRAAELLVVVAGIETRTQPLLRAATELDRILSPGSFEEVTREWALGTLAERLAAEPGRALLTRDAYDALTVSRFPEFRRLYWERHSDRAMSDLLKRRMFDDAYEAAGHYHLWGTLETGADQQWANTGNDLLQRILKPVLHHMSADQQHQVHRILKDADSDRAARWQDWCDSPKTLKQKVKDTLVPGRGNQGNHSDQGSQRDQGDSPQSDDKPDAANR